MAGKRGCAAAYLQHAASQKAISGVADFRPVRRQLQQHYAAAHCANRLTLENAESPFGVPLKTFEKTSAVMAGFLGELIQSKAADGYQAMQHN